MSDFRSAERTLKARIAALQRLQHEIARKCDWGDPEDRALYLRERRAERRDRIIPNSRVCPVCKVWKPNSRQWVVMEVIVCRGCFFTARKRQRGEIIRMEIQIFNEPDRLVVDGTALRHARQMLKISSRAFAERCGWSRAYQSQLEGGDVKTVTREKAQKIMSIIEADGGVTLDYVDSD